KSALRLKRSPTRNPSFREAPREESGEREEDRGGSCASDIRRLGGDDPSGDDVRSPHGRSGYASEPEIHESACAAGCWAETSASRGTFFLDSFLTSAAESGPDKSVNLDEKTIFVKSQRGKENGGEGGIRTHGPRITRSTVFETVPFDRSGTSPVYDSCGGEGGIRTHGRVSPTHAFQACSLSHSDTSPYDM